MTTCDSPQAKDLLQSAKQRVEEDAVQPESAIEFRLKIWAARVVERAFVDKPEIPFEDRMVISSGNRYTVTGTVKGQNAFGGRVQNAFSVEFELQGKRRKDIENARIVDVKLNGRSVKSG